MSSPNHAAGYLELVRWLINQGVAVAVALILLTQLGSKLDNLTNETRNLAAETRIIRQIYQTQPQSPPPLAPSGGSGGVR